MDRDARLEELDKREDRGELVDPREIHDDQLEQADHAAAKAPQPRRGNCPCGARDVPGLRHPGHRYGCPGYAKRPTRDDW